MNTTKPNYWLSTLAIVLFAVVFLLPFAFIVLTAVKTQQESSLLEFSWPSQWQFLQNLQDVIAARDYLVIVAFINSTILTVASVAVVVVIAAMAAFVLQRRKSRWTTAFNLVILSGLVIPPAVVPTIWVLQKLSLFKTMPGLILVEIAYAMAFCVLLFQAFIASIPRELDEAAIIDGAGPMSLFFRVVFPLLKPIIVTVVVVQSVFVWNDFANPLYFLPGDENATVQLTLFNFQSQYNNAYNLLFMDILLVTIPPLIMFMLLPAPDRVRHDGRIGQGVSASPPAPVHTDGRPLMSQPQTRRAWSAQMITPALELGSAPLFRKEVDLDPGHGPVAEATLHVSSLGIHEAQTQRHARSADDVLSPGWSAYEWRLRYLTHDVARPARGHHGAHRRGGQRLVPRPARLHGRAGPLRRPARASSPSSRSSSRTATDRWFDTDETWTAGGSDVIADDLYDGQTIDARRRIHRLVHARRQAGVVPAGPRAALRHRPAGAVRRSSRSLGRRRSGRSGSGPRRRGGRWSTSGRTSSAGSGSPRRAAPGRRSGSGMRRSSSTTSSAFVPLRDAQATDRFILSGGEDHFEPTMTFHGFRYAEVTGWPTQTAGALTADDLEAVVVHSDCAEPEPSSAPTTCSTSCTATSCGARRATSWTCPPTARSATSASAGPATSPSSHPLLRTCSTWVPSSRTGWSTSALEQRHADGMVPFVVPDVLKLQPPAEASRRPTRQRSGATPRCGCRGRCTRPTATARSSSGSTPR